jgi:CRISPR/Cas system-associated exonuclease Cas4 (RecB family)
MSNTELEETPALKWQLTTERSENYTQILRSVLKDWYSRPRDGWHVSDIIMCPRQRVFKTINPIPPTDREINMYSSGKSMHEAIQKLFMSNRMRFEIEKYVEYEGVQGSIDIYDKKINEPIEFKTLRSASIKEPKIFHVEQLMYYMAMLDVAVGQIIYQCILQFGDNPFVSFEVIMSKEERESQRKKLLKEIRSLQLAISIKDPSIARGVFSDKEMNWLCKDCPYVKGCEKIEMGTIC